MAAAPINIPTLSQVRCCIKIRVKSIEIIIPTMGARKINIAVLPILSPSIISFTGIIPFEIKAWQIAAPANPPIKVCEEEEGIPYHQVSKFQNMAAINPLKITGRVIKSEYTVLPMVLATA